jgi:hypothetical protein
LARSVEDNDVLEVIADGLTPTVAASRINSIMSLGLPIVMKSTNYFKSAIYNKLSQILVVMSGSIN